VPVRTIDAADVELPIGLGGIYDEVAELHLVGETVELAGIVGDGTRLLVGPGLGDGVFECLARAAELGKIASLAQPMAMKPFFRKRLSASPVRPP